MSRATLLVFSLGADAESRRRPLVPAPWRGDEIDLRRALFDAAVDAGREAGCRVEVSSPAPPERRDIDRWRRQEGHDFGERILDALGAVEADDGPVVLVGADVPGLGAGPVRAALDALGGDGNSKDTVVLGPSPDGGFYLLAAARPVAHLLGEVRWCRDDTLARVRRALEAAGRRVVLLDPLADLDRPADLERWLARDPSRRRRRFRAVVARLLRRLAERRRPRFLTVPPPRSAPGAIRRGRAPPRLFLVA